MDTSNLNMYGSKMNPEQLKNFLSIYFMKTTSGIHPEPQFVYGELMGSVKPTLQELLPKIEAGSL